MTQTISPPISPESEDSPTPADPPSVPGAENDSTRADSNEVDLPDQEETAENEQSPESGERPPSGRRRPSRLAPKRVFDYRQIESVSCRLMTS